MKNKPVTLREAAAELKVPPYVVVYALTSGKVAEPLKLFWPEDVFQT